MKILSIVGARPQFVKMAVLHRYIVNNLSDSKHIIIHTGQHYSQNMNNVFFEEMELPPADYNLGINNCNHGKMTARMLEKIEEKLLITKPQWVIVYGDTNSTLAGVIAASKLKIPVAHVEAGLRSFNMNMPEEVNRIIADKLSNKLFCPSSSSVNQLVKEGVSSDKVVMSGDIMKEAFNYYHPKMKTPEAKLPSKYVLCTMHRAENTDSVKRLKVAVNILNNLHQEYNIVLPVHPRLKARLKQFNLKLNCIDLQPQSYFQMLYLLNNSLFVITDSGGLQKEAFWSRKYCITMRPETEWIELVNKGYNYLTDLSFLKIQAAVKDISSRRVIRANEMIYGNGNSAQKIIESLY